MNRELYVEIDDEATGLAVNGPMLIISLARDLRLSGEADLHRRALQLARPLRGQRVRMPIAG